MSDCQWATTLIKVEKSQHPTDRVDSHKIGNVPQCLLELNYHISWPVFPVLAFTGCYDISVSLVLIDWGDNKCNCWQFGDKRKWAEKEETVVEKEREVPTTVLLKKTHTSLNVSPMQEHLFDKKIEMIEYSSNFWKMHQSGDLKSPTWQIHVHVQDRSRAVLS